MKSSDVPQIRLPSNESIPVLGQGTWHFAENAGNRADEVASLRLGLDLGMTLIDTAEMYTNGKAEEVAGEALTGRRDEAFIVSKVLPHNASRTGTINACKASLKRLKTDRIDLYLLHWRGPHPLAETLAAFEQLQKEGSIRHWGVSNFDVEDMEELFAAGGNACATNQVLYNLTRRGIEFDLIRWCQSRKIPIMAYSPIEQARLLTDRTLKALATKHHATPAQVALAWIFRQKRVNAIPKMGTPQHVRENRKSLEIMLDNSDLEQLDTAFPPPKKKVSLEML